MKRISFWAKDNPRKSFYIIGLCHLLATLNAIGLGLLLFLFDWRDHRWPVLLLGNIFILAYFFYPKKETKKGLFRHSYYRQKSHDFALMITYPLVIAFGLNNALNQIHQVPNAVAPTPVFIVHKSTPKSETNDLKITFKQHQKKIRKSLRKKLRVFKKKFRKMPRTGWGIVGGIFLTIVGLAFAFFLSMLVAVLACHISCSGNVGLGWFVLFVGWSFVLWLLFLVLKDIWFKEAVH